jgi:hypothetical protein
MSTSKLRRSAQLILFFLFLAVSFNNCGQPGDLNLKDPGAPLQAVSSIPVPAPTPIPPTPTSNPTPIMDMTAPVVTITRQPAPFTTVAQDYVTYNVTDNVSTHFVMDCKLDNLPVFCSETEAQLINLAEGAHQLLIIAVDEAGNRSLPAEARWFVDLTPPTIQIVDPRPSNPTYETVGQLNFVGQDAGSGIDKYMCKIDLAPEEECTSPKNYTGLAVGDHVFQVVAIDKAGLVSDPAIYKWTILMSYPPISLAILGYTGAGDLIDQVIDDYLALGAVTPGLHMTTSDPDADTTAQILADGTTNVLCQSTNKVKVGDHYRFDFDATCLLLNGVNYIGQVSAVHSNQSASVQKRFLVDGVGPVIAITLTGTDPGSVNAVATFNVTDKESGVNTVNCTMKSPQGVETALACSAQGSVNLSNLTYGTYTITVVATDKAGNSSTGTQSFEIRQVICDALSNSNNTSPTCPTVSGLTGNLYYLSAAQRALYPGSAGVQSLSSIFNSVEKIVGVNNDQVKRSSAFLKFSSLNIVPQAWTNGFKYGSDYVRDDGGTILIEWFGFDLNTSLTLAPEDSEGLYELAAISDDGITVQRNDTKAFIINAAPLSSPILHCMSDKTQQLNLTHGKLVPINVKYFQGPREFLALQLFWRKVSPTNSYSLCGQSAQDSSSPASAAGMAAAGWVLLKTSNYVAP